MTINEQHDAHVQDFFWELDNEREMDPRLIAAEMAAETAWLRAAEYDPEADAFEDYERFLGKF